MIANAESTGLVFDYNSRDMTAFLTGIKSKDTTDVVIPCAIYRNGKMYKVEEIEHTAFDGCKKLVSVKIPNVPKWLRNRVLLNHKF